MSAFKKIFSFAILLAIIIHFSIIILSINPVFKLPPKAQIFAMFYFYPFFDQGWNLFAPVPKSNYHLFVKYQIDDRTKQMDLIQEIKNKQLENRFNGYESLSLALSNSIHSFEVGTTGLQKLNGPIVNDINYTIVEHYAKQYVLGESQGKAKNIQLILLVENVVTKQSRVYF